MYFIVAVRTFKEKKSNLEIPRVPLRVTTTIVFRVRGTYNYHDLKSEILG